MCFSVPCCRNMAVYVCIWPLGSLIFWTEKVWAQHACDSPFKTVDQWKIGCISFIPPSGIFRLIWQMFDNRRSILLHMLFRDQRRKILKIHLKGRHGGFLLMAFWFSTKEGMTWFYFCWVVVFLGNVRDIHLQTILLGVTVPLKQIAIVLLM